MTDNNANNHDQDIEVANGELLPPAEDNTENNTDNVTETIPQRDLEAELAAMKDQMLRAVAEGENIRRRAEKQIEEAGKFAITSFARDLINVQENLYRATSTVPAQALEENPLLKTVVDGVEMTRRELDNVFQRHGITRIDPATGSAFDHNLHQAVAHIPDAENPEGTISNVMQAGYSLKDRLLRPAMVAVAKAVE
jgi:molecular chaperone GrpE